MAGAPDTEVAVYLVSTDQALTERLRLYMRRRPGLRLTVSRHLPPRITCDVLVLPVDAVLAAADGSPPPSCPRIAYGSARCLRAAFLAGCSDYLREPWAPEELECRVFRVLQKRSRRHEFAWGTLVVKDMKIVAEGREVALSYPESLLLDLLLRQAGRVVPREALGYTLWGKPAPSGSRALDVHISGLRKKLAALFPDSRISACRGFGYRLSGADESPESSSQTTAVP